MEISHLRGLAELGMEDQCYNNIMWPMNYFDELGAISIAASFGENLHHSFTHPTYDIKPSVETPQPFIDRPMKQPKTNSWVSCNTGHMSNPQPDTSPINRPFVNPNYGNRFGVVKPKEGTLSSKSSSTSPSEMASQGSLGNQNYAFNSSQGTKTMNTSTRLPQAQDHIIAERKRREKLSQKFIALSALIPGLKKMDKASVLGDAIKYLKQLQKRVNTLEEQNKKKSTESVVFVRKYELLVDGENSSLEENFSSGLINEPLPEIEARFSDKDVLIRIHCEKKKGILEKTVDEIEKFRLLVINSSAVTFGSNALDITIIAQMDNDFTMAAKDLVKNLRSTLKQFM